MEDRIAVSVSETCRQLADCSVSTVYRKIENRELEKIKVGGRTLITTASIKRLLGASGAA